MSDKVLTCQNCHNPFVYSEIEQKKGAIEKEIEPLYCPICQSIKNQEKTRPSKPKSL